MPVHVDHLVSDVISEAEPTTEEAAGKMEWEEVNRFRQRQARVAQDRLRTAAEGFND
jgi:hypothetical protein